MLKERWEFNNFIIRKKYKRITQIIYQTNKQEPRKKQDFMNEISQNSVEI